MNKTDKPVIAVDIDDVLARTAEEIVRFGNEHWGHAHTLDDFTEELGKMWQVDEEETERRWRAYMESGVFGRYGVIPDADRVLRELKAEYCLIAVTSRRVSLLDITRAWLDANYPGVIEEVISAKIYGENRYNSHAITKADVLKRLGADYLIDDQPKHCIGAAEVGVNAVLFGGYPWNKHVDLPAGIVRCDDWQAVLEFFDGRED